MNKLKNIDKAEIKPLLAKRLLKFEYGFNSVNGIIKKKYYLHEIPFIHDKCDVWNILPFIYVRQFTGMIDKNGIEIYEGDILELPSEKKGVVECLEGGFVLRLNNETIWQNLLFNVANHYSVVGDIYSN